MSSEQPTQVTTTGLLRAPVQARARATFEKILKASIDILGSEGINALNTNRVADEAGINIATLYSYFANKESILAHLAHSFEEARAVSVEEHALALGHDPDWQAWFTKSIDDMVQFRLDQPGCVVVRQALIALPDLAVYDRESTRRATEAKIPGLRLLNPDLTVARARLISRTYTLTATTMLDEAFHTGRLEKKLISELKVMTMAYLRTYLPA